MKNSNLSLLTPQPTQAAADSAWGYDSTLVGTKYYELSNHLGNVLTVFRDVVNGDAQNGYTVDLSSVADYSPFGVELDSRTQSVSDYRFGFQGQESDDEIKGEGNSINYKYRMHDPRVGRFFAIDPLSSKFPYYSTYGFSGNHVINSVELEGLEDVHVYDQKSDGTFVFIKTYRNEDLIGEVNRYNYKVNGQISEVVFKNNDIRIKYESVSEIDGKDYANQFNSTIPVSERDSRKITYTDYMINQAYNKGKLMKAASIWANSVDQSLEGTNGLRTYGDAMSWVGDKLGYVPLPIAQALSKGLKVAGEGAHTLADYDQLEVNDANMNLIVRATSLAASLINSKQLEKANLDKAVEMFIEYGVDEGLEKVKEELLVKPKDD